MRHNQGQNQKRSRGRGRRNSNHGQTNINRNTTFDSNGPDGRLRGNALQLFEKYTALAHDANAAGERISAEALAQFADHYYRINQTILQAAEQHRRMQEERQQNRKPEGAVSEMAEQPIEGEPVEETEGGRDTSSRPVKRGQPRARSKSQENDLADSDEKTSEEADEAVA
jgi:hypothetical protein